MAEKHIYSLSQVIGYIKKVIDEDLAGKRFWLKAEISHINFHRSGHCYIDLVENDSGKTLAQCRATIWSGQFDVIKAELGADLPNILKKGAEILCVGDVVFHPVYGLSIRISRVDKTHALGELERKKQETLQKLADLNLLKLNQQHPLPLVVQRIAVIGSPGTSGYADFLKQLEENEHAFDFPLQIYSCPVQGEHAAERIIERLQQSANSDFDVVVLIRGGGSKLDLEVFNDLELAKVIARHSIPVLTGIGHETDISVADIVANRHFKTPSALGSFIVDRAYRFYVQVNSMYNFIHEFYDRFMQQARHRTEQSAQVLQSLAIHSTRQRRADLHISVHRFQTETRALMNDHREALHRSREQLAARSRQLLEGEHHRWKRKGSIAVLQAADQIRRERHHADHCTDLLRTLLRQTLRQAREQLTRRSELAYLYNPERTLERGYSITRTEGRVLGPGTVIQPGDELEIELRDRILFANFIRQAKNGRRTDL